MCIYSYPMLSNRFTNTYIDIQYEYFAIMQVYMYILCKCICTSILCYVYVHLAVFCTAAKAFVYVNALAKTGIMSIPFCMCKYMHGYAYILYTAHTFYVHIYIRAHRSLH